MGAAPTQIGSYRILRTLGAGGMGEVFLARSVGPAGFAKLVVIKRILRHLDSNPAFIEMFLNEARLAALLQHPNVVQVFELGQEDGSYFLVMEYVHGVSARMLQQRMSQRGARIPPRVVIEICLQALKALDYAHTLQAENGQALDIVHRDVTPDNLLIGFNGVVKVLDFGIAKASMSIPTTAAGTVKGKFAYMSPEQIKNLPLDARSDVFAAGVVMYELLSGKTPFLGGSDAALLHAVLETTPEPLTTRVADLPPGLEQVVQKALCKDRNQRAASARELFNALEKYQIREEDGFQLSTFLREQFPEEATQPTPLRMLTPLPKTRAEPLLASVVETPVMNSLVIDIQTTHARRPGAWKALAVIPVLFLAGWLTNAGLVRSRSHGSQPPAARAVEPRVAGSAAPPPVPPVPLPTAAPSPGKVHIRVNPWAEVILDGKPIGMTPMPPRSVAAGAHVLLFKNSELGIERRIPLQVQPGQSVTVKVDLLD